MADQSPMIPGTSIQWAWDSSSLDPAKRCPQLYKYTIIDGWQPKDYNVHLRFGIEYHQALHDYDLSRAAGIPHADAIHDTIAALVERIKDFTPDEETKAGKYKNADSLLRSVIWYLDKFEHDKAETVILENGKPACEVSFRFETDYEAYEGQPYILCGHLDKVVNYLGDRYTMDRKTTTYSLTEYYWNQFNPHPQMTLYTLASQVIFNTPVKGVIIDAVQLLIGESRFERRMTLRTQEQIDEWIRDLVPLFVQYRGYAEDNHWPRNDTSCGMYGGCKFRDVCNKSPQVRQSYLESKFVRAEPWNPLKPR